MVVGVRHQQANPWLNAEGTEEISRDFLPVECVDRGLRSSAPDTERRIACLQGCEINELRRMLAEIFVSVP